MNKEKQFYQHRVSVWNYETGIVIHAIFRTREAAEKFKDETPGEEKSYTAEFNNWPYGISRRSFDAKAALERGVMWMTANGGVTGRD